MTIDRDRLKALAELNIGVDDVHLAPDVLLELLAEIERFKRELHNSEVRLTGMTYDRNCRTEELNQFKTENEMLRRRTADDERKLDALLAHCDDGECVTCGQIICKHGDGMHFHHDGCPSCAQEGEPDSDLNNG